MKLMSMLLTLLIVGYLVLQQIKPPAPEVTTAQESQDEIEPPKVPTRPQDLPKFDHDMNTFMEESKEKLDRQLEQAE